MFKLPEYWEGVKTLSEIFKNIVEALAVIGGVSALWKWLAERKDRATDILFELEREFSSKPEIVQGKECIEEDERYDLIKGRLKQYVTESQPERSKSPAESSKAKQKFGSPQEKEIENGCRAIDALLRFYVMLCGVRHAKQVPEDSLSICFRYWLCHYYNPERKAFREYVDEFYPTLRQWLKTDADNKYKFFRPGDFGWPAT
jgi:hypothetical protein